MTEYDVLVVGYGTAGAAAAIAAHDAGARVLVLEAGSAGGGNAHHSGGFLCELPADTAVDHLDALCFGRTPRSVLQVYADGLRQNESWLRALGAGTVTFEPPPGRFPAAFPAWPNLPAGKGIRYFVVSDGEGRRGTALWQRLHRAVTERGIEVRYGVRVERLLQQGDRATGVAATLEAGETGSGAAVSGAAGSRDGRSAAEFLARGGVVLACGGFEADADLADAYLALPATQPIGHPLDRGDGVRLGQQVGASMWHMSGAFGWFAHRAMGFDAPFALDFFGPTHLYLDGDGRRFSDEPGFEVHDRLRSLLTYLPRRANRPRLPGWAVFDEATRLAGPLNGMLGTPNDYVWSVDNSAEIAAGWIVAGDSPAALADQMDGVDPAVLTETLQRYNAFCAAGRDEDFDREAETLVPLDLTRLYAVQVVPGIAGTTGGPRHDERARVLRPDGSAIAGLYAAGAVSLVWGHLIEFGGGLTDALVFGRIAGAEAAGAAAEVTG